MTPEFKKMLLEDERAYKTYMIDKIDCLCQFKEDTENKLRDMETEHRTIKKILAGTWGFIASVATLLLLWFKKG